METSAKTNENIDDVFEWIALQIINKNIETLKDTLLDKRVEDSSKYIISGPQLKLLNQHFTKQLDYCIGTRDTKDIIKYLDMLKTIEKNKF